MRIAFRTRLTSGQESSSSSIKRVKVEKSSAIKVETVDGSDSKVAGSSKATGTSIPLTTASSMLTFTLLVHPFFLPKDTPSPSPFRWVEWIGGTCRHGVHLDPVPSTKVAAFDMDGTLIKPQSGARFPKDFSDWKWWADGDIIPKKLKELHDDGFAIVIVSNQSLSGIFKDPKKREPKFEKIGKKLPLIAAKIPSVPFRIFAATEKDQYRKPITGTWLELERLFRKDGVEIDLASSFYVGDAAGRPGDHHVSDRLYALNVGIPFYTPEEFFLKKSPRKFTLRGFHPSSLTSDPAASLSTSSPFVPPNPTSPEIVLFVGYPSVGKTSFYKKHFAPAGYVHVNQDKLKSKPNCLKAVREAIKAKTGCVVDNTNRDLNTRAEYHAMAKELRVPIRAIYFETKLELAWHINLYRAFWLAESKKANEDVRTLVPYNVYTNFQNALQPPTLEEGFSEVRTVDWVFEGSEEDRRRFNMYLDIF